MHRLKTIIQPIIIFVMTKHYNLCEICNGIWMKRFNVANFNLVSSRTIKVSREMQPITEGKCFNPSNCSNNHKKLYHNRRRLNLIQSNQNISKQSTRHHNKNHFKRQKLLKITKHFIIIATNTQELQSELILVILNIMMKARKLFKNSKTNPQPSQERVAQEKPSQLRSFQPLSMSYSKQTRLNIGLKLECQRIWRLAWHPLRRSVSAICLLSNHNHISLFSKKMILRKMKRWKLKKVAKNQIFKFNEHSKCLQKMTT